MAIDPHDYLTPARDHKRLAGWWVFWSGPPWQNGQATISCGKVARKQTRHVLTAESHDRVRIDTALVSPVCYDMATHWPKHEWGSYEPLPGLKAKAALIAAISEMAFEEEL